LIDGVGWDEKNLVVARIERLARDGAGCCVARRLQELGHLEDAEDEEGRLREREDDVNEEARQREDGPAEDPEREGCAGVS
jgi:hypothetical protein